MFDLFIGGAKDIVGQGDLTGVDATLAEKTKRASEFSLGVKTSFVADVGKGRVIREDTGFTGGQTQTEHRLGNRKRFASCDAERFEQVAQTQLQACHACIRASQFGGQTQYLGRLDIE